MRILFGFMLLLFGAATGYAQQGSYLFVWAGDPTGKASAFLAVLNADASSPNYGRVVTSVSVPGPSGLPHHTEPQMPADGFLLANAFMSGRTMLFDLRNPLHPSLAASFGSLDGFAYPHTYIRLPNNDVLATFQYHDKMDPKSPGGGLVEMTERGKLVRDGSATDPAAQGALIRPYSFVAIPKLDRVVSTNHSMMMNADGYSRTIQIWRLSDLKLLRTIALPEGPHGYEQLEPGEPRLFADGKTVLIHTFMCGLYELNGIATAHPSVHFLHTFDGTQCGVPMLLGHYWIQTLSTASAVVSLDISDLAHLREVSRVQFDAKQFPHWIAADTTGRRLVVDSGGYGADMIYILNFNPANGALTMDKRFRDPGSATPGVNMDSKSWPNGYHGDAFPHGAVFSRPSLEPAIASR